MYLLDTDHMSVLRYGGANALRLSLRLSAVQQTQVVTCVVVYEEQMRGWLDVTARSKTGEDFIAAYSSLGENLSLYCGMTLLHFDTSAAARFDELKRAKINIGTNDLKIAAIALANNATVLTRNSRHFGKVPNLHIEDWTE